MDSNLLRVWISSYRNLVDTHVITVELHCVEQSRCTREYCTNRKTLVSHAHKKSYSFKHLIMSIKIHRKKRDSKNGRLLYLVKKIKNHFTELSFAYVVFIL